MRRSWKVALVGASLLFALAGLLQFAIRSRARSPGPTHDAPPLVHAESKSPPKEPPRERDSGFVPGLDLVHVHEDERGAFAEAAGGTARLTLDPNLQRTAAALMASHHLPEAAIVLMDVTTGRLLAYASHVEHGPPRDLCVEATAPSASVFKIVTAAALVEDAHLGPNTEQCYSGGEQRIALADLTPDPGRDRWCTTLAGALGRSINTVFARLASERLSAAELEVMARRFGYGQPVPFDVPVQASALHVPSDPLELARTAAGFWNSTLSPLQAAEISAVVSRGGESVRANVVENVAGPGGELVWAAPPADSRPGRRAVTRETADQLATMMTHTLSEGTCFRAFHDAHGTSFLPRLVVAGKTGTLTDATSKRFYTWFTGFAPVQHDAEVPPVAVAVLVVNGPAWQVKANVIARDMLRAYFAAHEVRGVSRPSTSAVARVTR